MLTPHYLSWRKLEADHLVQHTQAFSEKCHPASLYFGRKASVRLHCFTRSNKLKIHFDGKPCKLFLIVLFPSPWTTSLRTNHWVFGFLDHLTPILYWPDISNQWVIRTTSESLTLFPFPILLLSITMPYHSTCSQLYFPGLHISLCSTTAAGDLKASIVSRVCISGST